MPGVVLVRQVGVHKDSCKLIVKRRHTEQIHVKTAERGASVSYVATGFFLVFLFFYEVRPCPVD